MSLPGLCRGGSSLKAVIWKWFEIFMNEVLNMQILNCSKIFHFPS